MPARLYGERPRANGRMPAIMNRDIAVIFFGAVSVLAAACGGSSDATDDGAPQPSPAAGSSREAATLTALTATPRPEGVTPGTTQIARPAIQSYTVPPGTRPHDVAPAADGGVWYTAQATGKLGRLDPETGETREFPLGPGSSPHGVIVGPDGAAWVTDSGQNAIVRFDPATAAVSVFPLPASAPRANLNTAVFNRDGTLWFTGQAGYYGKLDPATGKVEAWTAPRGSGPYGITATPEGRVFYASLAGSHIAEIDTSTGEATVIEPPTPRQGARRVWSDSRGNIWVSEWNAGQVARYEPATGTWKEWKLPGARPQAYAVYVDADDLVWLSDFGANTIVSFDPATERFTEYELSAPNSAVRQILGRPGEIWGAESGLDRIVVVRTD